MERSIIIISLLISVIMGDFVSVDNLEWNKPLYNILIRDQGDTGMCWSFATSSYIEKMYVILTRNRYLLSVQQMSDNVNQYMNEHSNLGCDRRPRPAFNGYQSYCALKYVEGVGIMTEYDYPFVGGGEKYLYNASYITPIGIRDVKTHDCRTHGSEYAFVVLRELLMSGVVLGNICVDDLSEHGGIIDNIESCATNHAILITDIIRDESDGKLYVKFQNSWGTTWGNGGFGYIYIGNETTKVNNRGILDSFTIAEVYNRYVAGTSIVIDKHTLDNIEGCSNGTYIALASTLFLLVVTTASLILVCVKLRNVRSGKNHMIIKPLVGDDVSDKNVDFTNMNTTEA